jgi:hypothetical protein
LSAFSFGFDVLCPCQSSIEMHGQVFHFIFLGRSTLPICTVAQVWVRRVNVICVDLLIFLWWLGVSRIKSSLHSLPCRTSSDWV